MIAFVILHYQAIDETKDCVKTIKEMVSGDKHVVIVDNASPNQSGKELVEIYENDSEVTVLISEKNEGFARGNNLGYLEAKKLNPRFVVVMNNDVFITEKDFTQKVNESYAKYKFDVLGPDIFSTKTQFHQNPQRERNYTLKELQASERKLRFKNKFKFLIRLKYFLRKTVHETAKQAVGFDKVQFDRPLHGAAYIFSESFIKRYDNCFYPETFMYYESYILHYLGQKDGLKFVYDPNITVIHHEDVATNQTYTGLYNKVIFVNKCLLDSCKIFIKIMKNDLRLK